MSTALAPDYATVDAQRSLLVLNARIAHAVRRVDGVLAPRLLRAVAMSQVAEWIAERCDDCDAVATINTAASAIAGISRLYPEE